MINIGNDIQENIGRDNLHFDVSSGEELDRAIQAGYPREQIVYNSDDLSLEVTKMALNYEIGRIIVYGAEELKIIEGVCKEKSQKVNALLHITARENNLIHEFITKDNSDFNFELPQNPTLFSSVFRSLLCSQYVNLLGFHFHMDSRFSDKESCQNMTLVLRDLIHNLKQIYGFNTAELNIGGFSFKMSKDGSKLPPITFNLCH
ncbi:MAG TPA: hypothetical protein VFC27_03395 [Anaerovoracaceae bacterium]|nr:hypothetical protein [Anaerovoracaceae bacterium]